MEKELPKEWVETDLKEVLSYRKGKKPKRLEEKEFEQSVPYLDIRALEKGDVRRYAEISSSNILDKDSVAIVWDGARSGWVAKGIYGAIGSTIAALTPIQIDSDYIYHFLTNQFDYLNNNTRGTGIPHVNPDILWNIQFPIPPLPEQKRIVDKLDVLFGHLDSLNTRLDRIPELLKNFRQQVLTQAVTGKLTGSEMKNTALGTLLSDIKYGTSKRSQYDIDGIPILRIPNINTDKGIIDDINLKYSELDNKEYEKLRLKEGDVLIIRSNGSVSLVGQSAIIRSNVVNYAYAGYLVRLRASKNLNPDYLNYALKSPFMRRQIVDTARSTSGVNNINTQEMKDFVIPVCKIEEQKEIVSRVESLFDLADQVEAFYDSLKKKMDSLPQAILNKAFKGELVPQDPNDEPASVLLERIKVEREIENKTKKERGKKVLRRPAEQIYKAKLLKNMNIKDVLAESKKPMTPKEVWQASEFKDDIEAFYAALKIEIENEEVVESSDKEFLELVK